MIELDKITTEPSNLWANLIIRRKRHKGRTESVSIVGITKDEGKHLLEVLKNELE